MPPRPIALRFLARPGFARPAGSAFRSPRFVPQETVTGFTAPAATYDKMRQMEEASAAPFERDVQQVADPAYRAAWDGWYHHAWLPFYQKYAGPDASSLTKLAAAFYSDEVAARAESFRQQLEHFYRTLPQQLGFDGRPVKSATGTTPTLGGVDGSGSGLGLPWWAWGLVVGGVGALGYLTYQRVREIQARRAALEPASTAPQRRSGRGPTERRSGRATERRSGRGPSTR